MNLHAIVSSAINAVNPFIEVSVKQSTGTTPTANYKPQPTYTQTDGVSAQIQPITGRDLKMMDALNIQAIDYALYLNGSLLGVSRPLQKGGDLVQWGGSVHLVTVVFETWPTGWCKVGVTLQKDPPWPLLTEVSYDSSIVTYDTEPVTYHA